MMKVMGTSILKYCSSRDFWNRIRPSFKVRRLPNLMAIILKLAQMRKMMLRRNDSCRSRSRPKRPSSSSSKNEKRRNRMQMLTRIEMGWLNKLLAISLIALRNFLRSSSDKAPSASWILRICLLK